MAKVELTLEEIISTLEHSNLPAIVVEGKDDIIIYRELENLVEADVISAGGRYTVLEIFKNKLTNPKLKNKKIVFIADKDTWVNTDIPNEYQHSDLIFTMGYSIENDVFMDYACEEIISRDNQRKNTFEKDKQKFIYWYALALQNTLNADGFENREISTSVHHLFNQYNEFSRLQENENYPTELKEDLEKNYALKIRGKSLLELFGRTFKEHKPRAMFEAIAVRPDNCINRIFNHVKRLF